MWYNFSKSTTPSTLGCYYLANKNRRTQFSPFVLIHANNAWRTDGPIGEQKIVPQLILPEDELILPEDIMVIFIK